MVRVKICGITRLEDARLAVSLGADALGFNFYEKSPRCLSPSEAWAILRKLPAMVSTVGVFVNWDDSSIVALAKSLRLSAVQLHGDESDVIASRCAKFFPVIKAFHTDSKFSLAEMKRYTAASSYLLDAAPPTEGSSIYGGTGQLANWKVAAGAAKKLPVLLAGGLTPENVGEAIVAVRPYAVDVASGVESRPGKKDPSKLRCFFAEVARANHDLSV